MRKHGWQLPYHPLQVVAVAAFLALAFAFFSMCSLLLLFEIKIFQYIVMGLYPPLITSVFFSLYIWCAAADPADPGVFRSKKYLKNPANEKHTRRKDSKLCGESTSSMQDANTVRVVGKLLDKDVLGKDATSKMSTSDSGKKNAPETCS